MAFEEDELNKRREIRAAQRKKRQAELRKTRLKLAAAAVALIACAAGLVYLVKTYVPEEVPESNQIAAPVETTVPETTVPPTENPRLQEPGTTVIHIKAAGDLNITDKVVKSANTDLGYDYTRPFLDVAHVLSDADLTMLNLEGNICGEPYGSATVSAPKELIYALEKAGVDVIQMANSYSIYNGMIGLSQTLKNIRDAGIEPIGAYSSNEEYRHAKGYTICEVQGVKVALVAFTKGMGSLKLPEGSENCVNVLYKDYYETYRSIDRDRIKEILKAAKSENPDIIIALLHWGSEYNDNISDSQENIVSFLQNQGVGAIIGTHSHLVHQIKYDELTGFLVAYSLGDFFGDGSRGGTNYSIILDLEITKDEAARTTRVTDYSFTPVYILGENECDGNRRVVRIRETMAAYDVNFVDKVTASAYESMKTALDRINERVKPTAVNTKK